MAGVPVNIYDVLRRMIEARPFQDYERAEALKILDELQGANAFGTVARLTDEGHEHDWYDVNRNSYTGKALRRCRVCTVEEVTG